MRDASRDVVHVTRFDLDVTSRHSRQSDTWIWHYIYVYNVRAAQPTDLDWDVIYFSRNTLAKIYVKDKNVIVSQTTVH